MEDNASSINASNKEGEKVKLFLLVDLWNKECKWF